MKTFYALLLIAAIAGGWWFLKSRNIDVFGEATSNKYSAGIVQSAADLWSAAKNGVVEFVSRKGNEAKQSSEQVINAAKQKTQAEIEAQKQSIAGRAKNEADGFFTTAINDVRGFLGLGTTTGQSATPVKSGVNESAFLGTVVKRGNPLTLFVSNALFKKYGVSEVSYDVIWGDGDSEHHIVYADAKNKFITHIFAKAGEYEPHFTFTSGENKLQYTILVVVQ